MTAAGQVFVVLCTVPCAESDALVDALLEASLVACVNSIGPVRSRYRWQGKLETSEETLLVMKTRADQLDALRREIVALHSYDLPEILEFAVDSGLDAYLAWVATNAAPGAR